MVSACQVCPEMTRLAEPMARLVTELKRLPGVGTRTAERLAFHVLRAPETDAERLAEAILQLRRELTLCSICNNVTDVEPCVFCDSAIRDQALICVVEEPTSIGTIEKTRSFQGVYHVLHGTLSPVNGVGPEQLRTRNLLSRLENAREVVLALSPTTEGEATAAYLVDEMRTARPDLRISRIATGVPAGADIEYADEITMTRALENRREL